MSDVLGCLQYRYACLHWSLVDEHAIQIFGGLCSCIGFREDNVGNATALTGLVVLESDLLDKAYRLVEVFLFGYA